jgi:hypothetical protein
VQFRAGPTSPALCLRGDVVVCHHVVYNVSDLVPFVHALGTHARSRVVLELPATHPLSHLAPYWRQFWDLDRPTGPTAHDCLAVLHEAGITASVHEWVDDVWSAAPAQPEQARYLRIRLCLPDPGRPTWSQRWRRSLSRAAGRRRSGDVSAS